MIMPLLEAINQTVSPPEGNYLGDMAIQLLAIQPINGTFLHARECFITFPNTEKRIENTTSSGVFLTNFEVFG